MILYHLYILASLEDGFSSPTLKRIGSYLHEVDRAEAIRNLGNDLYATSDGNGQTTFHA